MSNAPATPIGTHPTDTGPTDTDPTDTGPTITAMTREQAPDLAALDQWAFAIDTEGLDLTPWLDGLEWDRTYGAWLAGPTGSPRLAGIYSAHSVEVPVPGGNVPAAGLTWVGVHPRDRRRGVLTAMIRHHLDDVRSRRGEPFSLLFAAEPAIYGRFGYGLASNAVSLGLERGAGLRDVPAADDLVIDIDHADADRQAEAFAACYDATRAARPGWISRDASGSRRYPFIDPPRLREGAESLRVITASLPTGRDGTDPAGDRDSAGTPPAGELRGYAIFRRRRGWTDGSPSGVVQVREVVARDAASARALWGRLLDLDLTARVETPPLPVDDPLLHLLVNARAANPRLSDALWLRLVDLPGALTARRYATGVDVVLEVTDPLYPDNAGRWQLQGDRDGADCRRTTRPGDLALDVRELGSAFLGGSTLSALAAAGLLIAQNEKALHDASIAFSWPVAPYCGWEF